MLDLFCTDLDRYFLLGHTAELDSCNTGIEQFAFEPVSQRAQFLQFTLGG